MGLMARLQNWRAERIRRARLSSWLPQFRESGRKLAQRYAAAKPSRLESSALGWMRDYNSLIEGANQRLRERVRALVRNFPPFQRAISAHAAFVVGKGARFQSLVLDDKGKPDREARRRIEHGFRRWMDRASLDGRLHFYECQRLALRQKLETGEFFMCYRKPKAAGRHPLALQFVEADRVQGGLDVRPTEPGSIVWQGVEFDPETGERYGYHILRAQYPPHYEWGYDYLPESRVVHGYQVLRPDQIRGVTVFAPVIILADCMSDYMTAELDGAKMAAKFLAMVTSPDPTTYQAVRSPFVKSQDNPDQKIEDLENGIIEYLRPGEDVKFASSARVPDGFDRFTRFCLRMVGIVVGTPYEILSGDYTGINYSTARMSRQDYNLMLEPERFWLEQSVNRPVFREWLRWEALRDPASLPGYFQDPHHYEAAMWVPAGMPSPDPLREGKADIDNIKSGLDSPQSVILGRGGDPEQVLDEWADWKEECKSRDLDFVLDDVVTAMQTNPQALEDQDA